MGKSQKMSTKEIERLFMRIDADANGTVEWHEFMNYMLLENITLDLMKEEHFSYEQDFADRIDDPAPSQVNHCHRMNITCMLILYPEMLKENYDESTGAPKDDARIRNDLKHKFDS